MIHLFFEPSCHGLGGAHRHQSVRGLLQRDRKPFMLIFTPWVNLESLINLTYKSLAGSQGTEREALQAQEEHTSSTQKGLSWSLDSNPGPCCEATEATC